LDDDFSGLILQDGSPAIDAGVTQLMATDGELIPPTPITAFNGLAPDLGWKEHGAPAEEEIDTFLPFLLGSN
jgi:hypothetical protein